MNDIDKSTDETVMINNRLTVTKLITENLDQFLKTTVPTCGMIVSEMKVWKVKHETNSEKRKYAQTSVNAV